MPQFPGYKQSRCQGLAFLIHGQPWRSAHLMVIELPNLSARKTLLNEFQQNSLELHWFLPGHGACCSAGHAFQESWARHHLESQALPQLSTSQIHYLNPNSLKKNETPTFSNRVCCLWIFLTATIMVWPLRGDLTLKSTLRQTVGPSLHVEIGRNATNLTRFRLQRRRRKAKRCASKLRSSHPPRSQGKWPATPFSLGSLKAVLFVIPFFLSIFCTAQGQHTKGSKQSTLQLDCCIHLTGLVGVNDVEQSLRLI